MPDVLLERVLTASDGEYARRVDTDGRVWVRSTVSASLDGGEWTFGAGKDAWEELAVLPPAALDALVLAIETSGFLDTESDYGPPSTVIGGASERWTAHLHGRTHVTVLRGLPETTVPAVTAVADALHEALAAADQA
jgi:hypothetical protein